MFRPGAEFWRLWACALIVVALVAFVFGPARADALWASFYGNGDSGSVTASGRPFREAELTVAHPSWRFGTRLRVCFARCAVCTVTDRGPARWTGRQIDLSRGCARATGLERTGLGWVRVDRLD